MNDLKKQLSKNDSTIFSSLVLIATGPRFFGTMIFSRYLVKTLSEVLSFDIEFAVGFNLPVHVNEMFGKTVKFGVFEENISFSFLLIQLLICFLQ